MVSITIALASSDIGIICYLLLNAALAHFVNLTNFLVTKHTSALTLQVCTYYDLLEVNICSCLSFDVWDVAAIFNFRIKEKLL